MLILEQHLIPKIILSFLCMTRVDLCQNYSISWSLVGVGHLVLTMVNPYFWGFIWISTELL